MNERKTEQLVREQLNFRGYYNDNDLVIEEQRSDNARIQQLLKLASKSGKGVGKPEFLIHSKNHPNFLIVIECKADPSKHVSARKDRYAEYAVDGALLYATYLSKGFDVLAIGVSGQVNREVRVSHYLFLRGADNYEKAFGNLVLSFQDYYNNYILSPRKFNQEYEKLLGYTKDLNETLHAQKIKESQRSLLISGILIALQNPAFVSSFKNYRTAEQLAKYLVSTVTDELSGSDLPKGKLVSLNHAFSFIRTHSTLSTNKEFVQTLIDEIDEHINLFIRTYKYFDTIGQFYVEFLRYANNDKGLGIVLTPPHITELFTQLADVNRDSVVVDNCCGTGGFLISAMKGMIADAEDDSEIVKSIRRKQLVGIEFQDDIYALAVTNMVIHGDGKSNIHQGDCFSLAKIVKDQYGPNVGFLNPPYKTRKSDTEELEFVVNNLEILDRGGTCVAIIPMSCVLAQKGLGLELKRQILQNHTLEAAMSMPSDLFHNSKIGVITSIIVLTAHIPHPPDKKTWFGYWRDDGFIKVKGKGRVDLNNTWSETRTQWISAFRNRELVPGFSVMQKVGAADEWCAEAFLETDYSDIHKSDFETELREYVAFKVRRGE